MPNYPIIQEIDVLVATTHFFVERGIKSYRFSIARGKGIDTDSAKERLCKTFCSTPHFVPNFVNDGPDIIGVSQTEWWRVECKGSGKGVQSTQRNNFDRALASVVSYYEDETQDLPKRYEQYSTAQPYLGLALPASPAYLKELKRRVRQPLRKKLNLWVLLYEPELKSIRIVSPENSY